MSGKVSYAAGLAAEASVADHYRRKGYALAAERWRSGAGEIDLILRDGAQVVFVEVKRAKSLAAAAERLQPRQIGRLFRAAEIWLGGEPGGADTDARFDVALVDNAGKLSVIENALAA
ncbi:MAG: hypothetical protein HKN02_10925 [Rhodobacteraceae bacterium]|nr:hypothetical protein [Paracoccaceae bacterium]